MSDPYVQAAAKLFRVAESDVTPEMRAKAKIAVFQNVYGGTCDYLIQQSEAERLHQALKQRLIEEGFTEVSMDVFEARLIADAAKASEEFGDDECERFAEELRKKREKP